MELSPRTARNRGEYKRLSIYTIAASILAAACVVALIFTVWFTAVIIDDRGMEPTLERGDAVLCDKLALTFASPKRGELLCYRAVYGGGVYMGRVVGLAGEEVAINGGSVYINGCLLKEDYITEACPVDMESITVGEGMFLLLPDARSSMQSTASEADNKRGAHNRPRCRARCAYKQSGGVRVGFLSISPPVRLRG